jgi:hypothetical protein
VLGLLAVMLAGSVMAGAASAEPGPFWHHRAIGGKGEGAKIEPNAPENFSGKGGVQTLGGKLAGLEVEIVSPAVQVKGAIFNNEHQGQIKLALFYQPLEVKVAGVTVKECKAVVGQQGQFSNAIQIKGHLAWKWNGTRQQLIEQPQRQQKWDIIFTATEPQAQPEGTEGLPLLDLRKQGTFAEIFITGTGCGVLGGVKQPVQGSEVGVPSGPTQIEEWSKELAVRTIPPATLPAEVIGTKVGEEGYLQHVWVGAPKKEFQPLVVGLTFGGSPGKLVGQFTISSEQQEVSVFEK